MHFSLTTYAVGAAALTLSLFAGWFFTKRQLPTRGATWFMWVSTGIVALLNSAYSIWRHVHYESHAYDLGIFDQAIWHLSKFQVPASTVRDVANLFGDHFHPIIATLAPFYWVFHSPIVLLIAQGILFASIIPTAYFLARSLTLPAWSAAILAFAFSINPGLTPALGFDFHEIAFAAPLFILAFLFYEKKQWYLFAATIALLLMTKESMAIYVAAMGIAFLLKKTWRIGLAILGTGITWYFLVTRLIIPSLATTHTYVYWDQYSYLAPSAQSIPLHMARHPWTFLHAFFNSPEKLRTLSLLFASFGVLFPLLSWTLLPIVFIVLAEKMWSSNIGVTLFQFHYQVMIVVVFAVASLYGIRNIIKKFPKAASALSAAIPVFVLLLMLFVHWKTQSIAILWNSTVRSRPVAAWNSALRSIPADASVSASDNFVPHLSQRNIIYRFPRIRDAQWVILDSNVPSYPYTPERIADEQRLLENDPSWTLTNKVGSLTVYHRDTTTWIPDRDDDPATLH